MADRSPSEAERSAAAHLLPVVLYDGACRLCRAQADRVRRLARGRVRVEPLQQTLPRLPWVDADEAARALTLIDERGRATRGAAAVVELLARARPSLRALRTLYRLPGVGRLAEAAYALVAANRYALFGRTPEHEPCEGGTCALPFREREEGGRGVGG